MSKIFKIFIFSLTFTYSYAYQLCVVGASSGLGKELVYQGIDRNIDILALTSSTQPFTKPCRINSFTEIKNQEPFYHPNIKKENYWNDLSRFNYDHLVLTTGSKPFENDYSDKLFQKILENLSSQCKSISIVSAYGVGDSIINSNQGIKIMNAWYLKDTYRAKNKLEQLLNNYSAPIQKYVYRPKALSYGETFVNSISRKKLAKDILDQLNF